MKKSFHYSALKDWNDTPIKIRELPTLKYFYKTTENVFEEQVLNLKQPPGKTSP